MMRREEWLSNPLYIMEQGNRTRLTGPLAYSLAEIFSARGAGLEQRR